MKQQDMEYLKGLNETMIAAIAKIILIRTDAAGFEHLISGLEKAKDGLGSILKTYDSN
jgi:hypothetical protein